MVTWLSSANTGISSWWNWASQFTQTSVLGQLKRQADDAEQESFREFLASYRSASGPGSDTAETPTELVALCRAVLTSNEFFFID